MSGSILWTQITSLVDYTISGPQIMQSTGLFGGHRYGQWTDKSGIAC